MKKLNAGQGALLALVFLLSGCVTRTYEVTKDRVDQDLSAGNKGYLDGKVPDTLEEKERKTTRSFQAIEVELPTVKLRRVIKQATKETEPEVEPQETIEVEEGSVAEELTDIKAVDNFKVYTVQSGDTLEKISKKFYGTTTRWQKIFDANRQILRSPDRLYIGQELKIPVAPPPVKEKTK